MKKEFNGNKRRARKLLLILIFVPVFVVVGGFVAYKKIYSDNLRPLTSEQESKEVVFTIASGTSVKNIGKNLKAQKLIRSDWAFGEYVRSNGYTDQIKAGTYKLKSSQDIASIVDILRKGKEAVDLFTIFPAQRLDQIKKSMIEKGGFSAADVEKAFDPALYLGHSALSEKPKSASLEGYLYPDSYQKTPSSKPSDIIKQSLDEMAAALTTDVREKMKSQGLTVHEGVILASIVEKEIPGNPTKPNENRQKAAQVFLKRKNIGMMLGSDVTACYGAIIAGAMKTGDNCDDFVYYKSDYNTRLLTGMPPGPISNVSISSLLAVAEPASTGYLFFVAGKDCVTRFSNTNAEHEELVAKYGLSTQGGECN